MTLDEQLVLFQCIRDRTKELIRSCEGGPATGLELNMLVSFVALAEELRAKGGDLDRAYIAERMRACGCSVSGKAADVLEGVNA